MNKVQAVRVQLYTPADGDNWLDIFINDKKVYGGHSISAYMLLQLLSEYDPRIEVMPLVQWEDNSNETDLLELGRAM